jgi:hypothetical protein
MNTKQKGNNFERDCSRMLSLWWTNGKRDDAIWRSASSGALTTVGKGRYLAHTGDFAATDGEAELLFKHVIIEAKRGYNRYSVQDLVDVPEKALAKNPVHEMLTKLITACQVQRKIGWLLWKKDRRDLLLICTDFAAFCAGTEPPLVIPHMRGHRLAILPWKVYSDRVPGPHMRTVFSEHDAKRQAPSVCGAQTESLLRPLVASSLLTPLKS